MVKRLAVLFFAILVLAYADTLTFRNGVRLTGECLSADADQIRFKVDGVEHVYSRKDAVAMTFTNDCDTLDKCQEALNTNRNSSLIHFRMGEIYLKQNIYQSAINEFREALRGDLDPKWIEASAHVGIGKIYDISTARDRALNEYRLALRTNDNSRGALDEARKYTETPYSVK